MRRKMIDWDEVENVKDYKLIGIDIDLDGVEYE